ncbi:MAG: hypothetical protein ACRDMH_10470 [Solirubrobacterales bacterium]
MSGQGQNARSPAPAASWIGRRALVTVAALVALALGWPAAARAGTYRGALCNPDLPAYHADAAFERSSRRYRSSASCGIGGDGLYVGRGEGATGVGTWGAWVIHAPRGTVISGLSVKAAGRARRGQIPELVLDPAARPRPFARPTTELRRFRWAGAPSRSLAARLRCRRPSGCPRGRGGDIRIKRVALVLEDGVDPTLKPDGSLFGPGSRRGVQTVAPVAGDVGGGVRRILFQVNGEPVTAHTVGCRLVARIALRLQPCPGRASARFSAATASSPFRQGPNLVRVCAADYGVTTAANRSCVRRRVRVDNLCPLSGVGGAATLDARLRRRGRRATVVGQVLDGNGLGVRGARICLATRVRLRGLAEQVVAAPVTGEDGRFSATLPPGPSREVRVACWPSSGRAIERYLRLEVPARPRLRLRPRHPIANGSRVRFTVWLPGPENQGRRVKIQARAGHRWVDVRSGLAGARGIYRAGYRFRATTGRRRYRFRAVVPKQRGYPYEAGTSRVRRATVLG